MTQDFEYVLDMLNVHKELQESIIRDITRRIVKNAGLVTETAAWQAECAQQSGIMLDEIIKTSADAAKVLEKEIKKAFDDAETKIFDYDDAIIEAAGFDPVEFKSISPEMADIWSATLSKTSTEAVNLTKTVAVTSQSKYIQACDLASMQVSSGAFSYDTAIRNAIKSAAVQGVSVLYPSGWVDSLDVAVRRSVLTGVNQTAGQLQMMRANELDNDIMEITAHAGARFEHALWQGKLVSLSGKKGYLSLSDIGYGDVRGFMGANCRHNWHNFFVGISTPAYTSEQLEEFKNATVTYDGKDVPLWKANDYQRAIERDIKAKKRQLVALDEAMKNTDDALLKSGVQTDFDNLAVKLKSQEARLKDFCQQTGIPRQPSREQVFSVKTENGIKSWGKSVSQKAVWGNKKAVDNFAESGIMRSRSEKTMFTGGILENGALNPDKAEDFKKAQKHAIQYYEDIRKRISDVETISKNTNWSLEDIKTIKNHIFINKYDLGGDDVENFFPHYDIAISWQNLIEGKNITEKDIILLRHELYEYHLMTDEKMSYKQAHKLAEEKYNYSKAVQDWRKSNE